MTEAVQDEGFADGFDAVTTGVTPVRTEEVLDPALVDAALSDSPLAGYTTDQLKALLGRVADFDSVKSSQEKLAGHIGNVLQELKALKQAREPELPKVDLSKFGEDFPDIYNASRQMIAESNERTGRLEQQLAEMAASSQKQYVELQTEILDGRHPDWRDTLNTPDYKMWLVMQSPETQKVAQETASAAQMSHILTAFKGTGKKQVQQEKNKSRLENALTPTGAAPTRPTEVSENDAFLAAFKAVRGG